MRKFSNWVTGIASILVLSIFGGIAFSFTLLPFAVLFNSATTGLNEAIAGDDIEAASINLSHISTLYANDGTTKLANFYTQNRIVVPMDKISQHMKDAIVAHEDRRFYQHNGIDLTGLIRAALTTFVFKSDQMQGGSGITQQYVKNLLINQKIQQDDPIGAYKAQEPTIFRKLREASQAMELEQKLTKDEILNGYLNIAPFGPNLYGVETAARRYFSVNAKDLNIVQAATIAAITKNPTSYDPTQHPQAATVQRDTVLDQMFSNGYITQAERDEAQAQKMEDILKLSDVPIGCQTAKGAAFFCDYIRNVVLNNPVFGENEDVRRKVLYTGGLNIVSTLDSKIQNLAEEEVFNRIPATDPSGVATAIVTIEPGTGKIKAMAQNREFDPAGDQEPGHTAINYAVDQTHGGSQGFSIASSFKPFILADWLLKGNSLNALINGTSRSFKATEWVCNQSAATWKPQNAGNANNFSMTVLKAVQISTNIPFLEMATKLGLCSIFKTAAQIGFKNAIKGQEDVTDESQMYASALLGTINASPLNIAESYATFASGGIHCDAIAIEKITTYTGEEVRVPEANCQRVLPEDVADAVTYALSTVITAPGALANGQGIEGHDAAVKTGTANDNQHLWAIGYTRQYCTAIWAGNPYWDMPLNNMTINGIFKYAWFGADLPIPMWHNYMTLIHEDLKNEPFAEVDPKFMVPGKWGKFPVIKPTPKPKPEPSPEPSKESPSPSPSLSPSPSPSNTVPDPDPSLTTPETNPVTPDPDPSIPTE
ncbi:MAG: penicillin-binding protein [Bifidobacteriaceae bacterium]|nr:penicillin-binding protein [Bifidobacteriaceae bacterium]